MTNQLFWSIIVFLVIANSTFVIFLCLISIIWLNFQCFPFIWTPNIFIHMMTLDTTLKLYLMHDSKFTTFIITSYCHFLLSKRKPLDCIEVFELQVCCESTLQNVVRIPIDFSKQKQNFSFIFANITLLLVGMMDDSENQAISHKGERCQRYSMEFKKATIKHSQENSIHSATKIQS